MSKNIIYSGKCGTGKTLRLILSGYESCRAGKKVVLVTFDNEGEFIAHKLMFIDKFYKENGRIPTFEEAKNDIQKYDLTKAELYLRNFFIHRMDFPNWRDENKSIENVLNLIDKEQFDVLMLDNVDFFIKRIYHKTDSELFIDDLKELKIKCDKKNIDLYITRQLPCIDDGIDFKITEL